MDRDNNINCIKSHPEQYLKRDKSGKGYICPICQSGTGSKGTGLVENPKRPQHFTCFANGCFKNSDIFDICQAAENLNSSER